MMMMMMILLLMMINDDDDDDDDDDDGLSLREKMTKRAALFEPPSCIPKIL